MPARVLRECVTLSTLLLQDNPLTADQLRESEGFAEYNARRLAKCDKQVIKVQQLLIVALVVVRSGQIGVSTSLLPPCPSANPSRTALGWQISNKTGIFHGLGWAALAGAPPGDGVAEICGQLI